MKLKLKIILIIFLLLSVLKINIYSKNMQIENAVGVNIPYLLFLKNNKIENIFKTLKSIDIKIVRIFISFNGNTKYSFQKKLGKYNEKMFKKLDYVISTGEKYNMKFILVLMDNNSTYGGKEVYQKWLGGANSDIFFKDKISRAYFKKYILKFINRKNTITKTIYKNDSSIFAWDLCNNAENNHDDTGIILYNWIKEMADFLKSKDFIHKVCINLKNLKIDKDINEKDIFLIPSLDFVYYNFLADEKNINNIQRINNTLYKEIVKPIITNFSYYSSDKNFDVISKIAYNFFRTNGRIFILNYGGFYNYSKYKGSFDFTSNKFLDFIKKLSKNIKTIKSYTKNNLKIENLKIIPYSQKVNIKINFNKIANAKILYGKDFPLKNVKAIKADKKINIMIDNLDYNTKYKFIIIANTDKSFLKTKVFTFKTLKLKRLKSIPFKRSNNFITRKGIHFYDGNRIYRYLGTSNYYMRNAKKEVVNYLLREAKKIGFKVIRVGSNAEALNWSEVDKNNKNRFFRIGPDYFNEDAYKELDYVLYVASQSGLRVILHFTDNWEYYGGVKVIAKWAGVSKNEFWTSELAKKYYKQSVEKLVNRVNKYTGIKYRDDPTIFAWDLCNEPRDEDDLTGKTLTKWIDEMSTYVKSIDPNHLVTTGIEGFYLKKDGTHYSGTDYILNHKPKNIDFCTFHIYPTYEHNHFSLSTTKYLIKKWIKDGHEIVGKPVVMEEYGIAEGKKEYPKAKWIEEMTKTFFENGGDGANYWFLRDPSYPSGDGFEVSPEDIEYVNVFIKYANILNKNGY